MEGLFGLILLGAGALVFGLVVLLPLSYSSILGSSCMWRQN